MPLISMTGFARAADQDERSNWTWEARSVNGKSLDLRCRVPSGFDALEQLARRVVAERFKRGNVSMTLSVERRAGVAAYRVNRELLDQVLVLRGEYAGKIRDEKPTLEGLMAIRGMIEPIEDVETDEAVAARTAAIAVTLNELVAALAAARAAEGERLDAFVATHLNEIEMLVDRAATCAAARPDAIRARLQALVGELLEAGTSVSEDRLAQEAALLVGKADVREELDRLRAHVAAANDLMDESVAVGRRFDFLCQEFNREVNTLCSKSADVELTRIGLDLKAAIERLREQIQNVE